MPKAGENLLSSPQQRLLFLDQFIAHRATYNIPVAWRITGFLDLGALEAALERVVRRHECLRSSFVVGEGMHGVRIGEISNVSLKRLSADSEDEALALATREACSPFDLSTELPIRCATISLNADEYILVLNVHHIAADGWSMKIILRDLLDAYASLSAGNK